MIKAVLFDMDGVLIDAKDWHYEALNYALDLFGIPISSSRDEHLSVYDGLPTRDKLKILEKKIGLPPQLHNFINLIKQRKTEELCATRCRPNFVNEYALSRLKSEGYKIAVCSNSIRKTIEMMMELAALRPYIDVIVSNQDVSKGKPDPEMYIKAMTLLNVKPNEVIICEDNDNGIRAAIASGGNLLRINEIDDTNYQNIKLMKLTIPIIKI